MERETRLELATLALARRCSTTELLPLSKKTAVFKVVERNVPLFLPLCPEALLSTFFDLSVKVRECFGLTEPAKWIARTSRNFSLNSRGTCAHMRPLKDGETSTCNCALTRNAPPRLRANSQLVRKFPAVYFVCPRHAACGKNYCIRIEDLSCLKEDFMEARGRGEKAA